MADGQRSESTDSTDSYDSDEFDKSYKSSSLQKNYENIKRFTGYPSDTEKVLRITRSGASRAEPSKG